MEKPRLLLVAASILPDAGSEPSKGMAWSKVLARFYRLEILTLPTYARVLKQTGMPEGCRAHAVGEDIITSPNPLVYLRSYERWCQELIPVCQELCREGEVAGLHHVTLGSFRVLPRYDRLKVPYTLGPLGGGECIPPSLLPEMRLPMRELALESARYFINHAYAFLPRLRPVLAGTRLALATTPETAALLRTMGARQTAVVFPDAIDTGDDDAIVLARREGQAATLPARVRCVCAGRSLWWKGIHLGIDFVHRLRQEGINATLDVYSDGRALPAWKARAAGLGLGESEVAFHGMVPMPQLMQAYESCHLFINPTMHDSSSPALLEAYATGLPSMTLHLGGAATVTTSQTGLNERFRNVPDWIDAGHRMVAGWVRDPARWVEACRAAKARTHHFGPTYLEGVVREHLEPIFAASSQT